MATLTHSYNLDMVPGGVPLVIHVSQYDSDIQLVFNLYASTGTLSLPSGWTASIRGTKPDGHGISVDSYSYSYSAKTVTINLTKQMTACAGRCIYEIVLESGSNKICSANFVLQVERAALDADTIRSDSVLRELQDIIDGAATATAAAETATEAAETAVGAATGTVRYDIAQSKTDAEKKQARVNIGAANTAVIAPAFSTSTAYVVGDVVTYDDKLYKFTSAHSAGSWNSSHVTEITVKDTTVIDSTLSQAGKSADAQKTGQLTAPQYSTSGTYAVGDYCIYQGTLYRCTTAISTAEAWTSGHWTAVNVGSELSDLKADLANKEQLPADTDFDELKETGVYGLHKNITYINSPKSYVHGVLEVWKEIKNNTHVRSFQKVTFYTSNVNVEVWGRIWGYNMSGGIWTNWIRLDAKNSHENQFINEIHDEVLNATWSLVNGTYLEFVEVTNRIGTGVPYIVDYDLRLSANEGYNVSVFEIKDMETPALISTGLFRSGGWVTDAYIPKNTPFYFQIRKTTNGAIDPSEFLSSITSDKSEKELTKVFDLCMFAGQSNMAGRGVTSQQWPETAPVVTYGAGYEFKAITNPNYISPLAEPFGKNENNTNGINDGTMKTGSMAAAFVNAYYANNGNIPVIAVSASVGGSGIDDWQPNTAYLNDAISRFNAAKNFIVSRGYTIRHMFLVWCQGEHEAGTPETTDDASYINDFNTMFNALKTATGIEKCLLCRIGEYNGTGEDFSTVIQKQTELAKTNKDVIMVTTTLASFKERGLMKDTLHFYQAGYNEMGEYAGINSARYVMTGKEPSMYDPKSDSLYYSEKN